MSDQQSVISEEGILYRWRFMSYRLNFPVNLKERCGAVESLQFCSLKTHQHPMTNLFSSHAAKTVIKVVAVVIMLFVLVNVFG
jgi:hypothetical protein